MQIFAVTIFLHFCYYYMLHLSYIMGGRSIITSHLNYAFLIHTLLNITLHHEWSQDPLTLRHTWHRYLLIIYFSFLKLKKKQRYAPTHDTSTHVFKRINQIARFKQKIIQIELQSLFSMNYLIRKWRQVQNDCKNAITNAISRSLNNNAKKGLMVCLLWKKTISLKYDKRHGTLNYTSSLYHPRLLLTYIVFLCSNKLH